MEKTFIVVFLILIGVFSVTSYLAVYGQRTLAQYGLSSPGLLVQDVWVIPNYVSSSTWPYLVRYFHVAPLSILGPTFAVQNDFQAFNRLGVDVVQLDGVLGELIQHRGPLSSADPLIRALSDCG